MDNFFENLDDDEIRTMFFIARQTADTILHRPVCNEFLHKDAETMTLAMAVSLEILRRYKNT